MDENEEYLQPGFDPNRLTMPQLRGIFTKYDIDYPSNAKKAALVDIFESELAPKAASILSKSQKIKASARGIVNAEDYGTIGELEIEPTPRKRNTRRKAASSVATDDDGHTAEEDNRASMRKSIRSTATPRKRTASPVKRGRKSSAAPRQEEEDEEPEPVVVDTPKPRRGRKSMAAKTPEPAPPPPREATPETPADADESVFSSYNPFQMGSSPRYQPSPDKDRRRTMPAKESPKKADTNRRKTEGIHIRRTPGPPDPDSGSPTFSKTISVPISRFKSLSPEAHRAQEELDYQQETIGQRLAGNEVYIKQEEDSVLEPGEEFVPEEQLEVELEDENANAMNTIARRRTKPSSSGTTLSSIFYSLIVILSATFFVWWRKEKLEVGYCGVGKDIIRNPEMPDWVYDAQPQCEPCPPHAICYQNLHTDCEADYVLVRNPWSLFGLVPLPPSCQPDSEKIRRVSVLTEAIVKRLRDRAAAVECGEIQIPKNEEDGIPEITIRNGLYDMKSPSLSDAQFNELWVHAIAELENKDEIITSMSSGGERYFQSTNLSHVSFKCAAKKYVRGTLVRYRFELAGLLLLLGCAFRAKSYIEKRGVYQRQVQRLVQLTLRRLAHQQKGFYSDPQQFDVSYIPVNQLRDQILSREFDPVKRQELWQGVSKVVESNSNVRTSQMEVMGEVMRCWTWIGSSALLEASANAEEEEGDSQRDERELRSIMGDEHTEKKELVQRGQMTPRILY